MQAAPPAGPSGGRPSRRPTPDLSPRLFQAALEGNLLVLERLLEAGVNPDTLVFLPWRFAPLHAAANQGHYDCCESLLEGGATPSLPDGMAWTALHWSAAMGQVAVTRLLLRRAPELATARTATGHLALELAVCSGSHAVARIMLTEGPLLPADELLTVLARGGVAAQPLFADVAARQPLTRQQWARLPSPCAGLGAALPAVQARSSEEAAALVRHLPPADRSRLLAVALCLGRVTRRLRLPMLPAPAMARLLALSAA